MARDNSFFRFSLFYICIVSYISFGIADDNNCLPAKDKPQLKPDEKLVIELFYVYDHANGIETILCDAVSKFNGLVTVEYRMGALTTKVEGPQKVACGPYPCDGDRYTACKYKSSNGFKSCQKLPSYDPIVLSNCYCAHESDEIIISNGTARENYGISDKNLPALVFKKKYDPCVKTSNSEEIKAYICGLYNKAIKPCQ